MTGHKERTIEELYAMIPNEPMLSFRTRDGAKSPWISWGSGTCNDVRGRRRHNSIFG